MTANPGRARKAGLLGAVSIGTALAAIALMVPSVAAQAPAVTTLQGQVSTVLGPVAGPADFAVSLYTDAVTDVAVYVETWDAVDLVDGRFALVLGEAPASGSPPFEDVLAAYPALWVGMVVDQGDELPRRPLTSSPYAVHTRRAETADSLGMTCDVGYLLTRDATGWVCTGALGAAQINVPYALGDGKGGAALDVACPGCVGSADLAGGAVASAHIQDGGVSSSDVAFMWAAGASKGGAAADLACSGCVSGSEIAVGAVLAGEVSVGALAFADDGGDSTGWAIGEDGV